MMATLCLAFDRYSSALKTSSFRFGIALNTTYAASQRMKCIHTLSFDKKMNRVKGRIEAKFFICRSSP
jgi:hypothetical protein